MRWRKAALKARNEGKRRQGLNRESPSPEPHPQQRRLAGCPGPCASRPEVTPTLARFSIQVPRAPGNGFWPAARAPFGRALSPPPKHFDRKRRRGATENAASLIGPAPSKPILPARHRQCAGDPPSPDGADATPKHAGLSRFAYVPPPGPNRSPVCRCPSVFRGPEDETHAVFRAPALELERACRFPYLVRANVNPASMSPRPRTFYQHKPPENRETPSPRLLENAAGARPPRI